MLLHRFYPVLRFSSHNSPVMHSTNNNTCDESFLSNDRSGSSLSQTSNSHMTSDDSFIVQDSDSSRDGSFLTADEASFEEYEASPPPRTQPNRFAKVDLNTPKLKRPLSQPSPSQKTPVIRAFSKHNNTPLAKAATDEERALLLECYPELAEENYTINQKEESIIEISEEENFEEVQSVRSSSSCSSASSDDSFERYLKLLKGGKETDINENDSVTSDQEESHNDEKFIVSDSESVYCSSDSENEEVEELSSDDTSELELNSTRYLISKPKPKVLDNLINSFKSPSLKNKKSNTDDYFLASLSANYEGSRHPDAVKFATKGIKNKKLREELTEKIFEILKRRCFDNEAGMDRINVVWNVRLLTTAGLCKNNVKQNCATIDLSIKVCTTPERLRDTLVHEMCHAATLLIDSQVNARHGPWWQKWTRRCMQRCPSLPFIGRCHAYKIEKKFIYQCDGCGQKIGRHSKSFKTEKFVCGVCKGHFVLTKNGQPMDGEFQPKMNKFAIFVKENYGLYKKNGTTHNEVMKILSAKWKETLATPKSEMNNEEVDVDISILSIHD